MFRSAVLDWIVPCWLFKLWPVRCTFCAEISPLRLSKVWIDSLASALTEPITPWVLLVFAEFRVNASAARIWPWRLSISAEFKLSVLALCKRPWSLFNCCAVKSKLWLALITPFWLSTCCAVIFTTFAVSLPCWLSKYCPLNCNSGSWISPPLFLILPSTLRLISALLTIAPSTLAISWAIWIFPASKVFGVRSVGATSTVLESCAEDCCSGSVTLGDVVPPGVCPVPLGSTVAWPIKPWVLSKFFAAMLSCCWPVCSILPLLLVKFCAVKSIRPALITPSLLSILPWALSLISSRVAISPVFWILSAWICICCCVLLILPLFFTLLAWIRIWSLLAIILPVLVKSPLAFKRIWPVVALSDPALRTPKPFSVPTK